MYGIAGERRLDGVGGALAAGLSKARRRCGSAMPPHGQLQLDVYRRGDGRAASAPVAAAWRTSESGWALQRALARASRAHLAQPDEGIWEVRGGTPALHPLEGHGLGGLRSRHQSARAVRARRARSTAGARLRDEIHADVCRHGLRSRARQLRAVVRQPGSSTRACCCCRVVGFLPPDDPRVRGTVAAIEQRLLVDGFVLRYDTGSTPTTGCRRRRRVPRVQLLAGRRLRPAGSLGEDARDLFERLLALLQRCRSAQRGVRSAPADVWSATSRRRSRTSGAGQQRVQPDARSKARRAARRAAQESHAADAHYAGISGVGAGARRTGCSRQGVTSVL